ncbi:GNAT family N-acetyltransferase [Vibrio gallicus]|uniref:GNAT family N-acetyltransferase n=1 Tax=Vibrio gallicus TaxID=190897 RepID=UPI0021C2876A|nr:GNAT family protein [Vibrio gallicus]
MPFSTLRQGQSIPFHNDLTMTLIQADDLADIIEMLNDNQANQYLFFAPADNSLYDGFFNPIIDNTKQAILEGCWPDNPTFILRDAQGSYMGMCALTSVMFLEGNFEVGYQLPTRAWQQGIASACCKLMTQLAFEQLNAHKVSADCYAGNIGSYKTLEKCGYRAEGCQKQYYTTADGYDDKLYYGLTVAQYHKMQ